MARKTYTSTAVKQRWNRKHYDSITFTVQKGARSEVQELAESAGVSVSEYIRQAIKEKAEKDGKIEILQILRGGGIDPAPFLRYDEFSYLMRH